MSESRPGRPPGDPFRWGDDVVDPFAPPPGDPARPPNPPGGPPVAAPRPVPLSPGPPPPLPRTPPPPLPRTPPSAEPASAPPPPLELGAGSPWETSAPLGATRARPEDEPDDPWGSSDDDPWAPPAADPWSGPEGSAAAPWGADAPSGDDWGVPGSQPFSDDAFTGSPAPDPAVGGQPFARHPDEPAASRRPPMPSPSARPDDAWTPPSFADRPAAPDPWGIPSERGGGDDVWFGGSTWDQPPAAGPGALGRLGGLLGALRGRRHGSGGEVRVSPDPFAAPGGRGSDWDDPFAAPGGRGGGDWDDPFAAPGGRGGDYRDPEESPFGPSGASSFDPSGASSFDPSGASSFGAPGGDEVFGFEAADDDLWSTPGAGVRGGRGTRLAPRRPPAGVLVLGGFLVGIIGAAIDGHGGGAYLRGMLFPILGRVLPEPEAALGVSALGDLALLAAIALAIGGSLPGAGLVRRIRDAAGQARGAGRVELDSEAFGRRGTRR